MKKFALLLSFIVSLYANEISSKLVEQGCHYLSNKEYEQAKKIFEEASFSGDAEAMHNLGLMYINGDGVPQDYHKALSYFQKALENKRINSAYDIGVMYRNGEGVTKDLMRAKEYYLISANNNYSLAQFELAKLYGIEQNMQQFQSWAEKAVQNGFKPVTENDQKIISLLQALR